jgi:hypothetical protein
MDAMLVVDTHPDGLGVIPITGFGSCHHRSIRLAIILAIINEPSL